MRRKKIRIIMAGFFCVGVLMGGLGTGVAFAEFSSFAYQPVNMQPEVFQTEKFTCAIPQDGQHKVLMQHYFGDAVGVIEEHEEVLEGTAEIYITYNQELCSIEFVDYLDAEDNVRLQIYLDCGSDWENLMRVKDDFLEGLKNRELHDYQVEYIQKIELWVNPKDREKIGWR